MSEPERVIGIHSVEALLKTAPQRVRKVFLARERQDKRMQHLLELAAKAGIDVQMVDRKTIDALSSGTHQGVVAEAIPGERLTEKELYSYLSNQVAGDAFVLVLDGVTDPHNLGACLRSADAAGVHLVIVPRDNSAGLTETARKVASGAAETVPLVAVTNLVRCLKKLQDMGMWISGAAGEAEFTIYDADLSGPRVIVMGAEGAGLRRLTRENCDQLVKIPMHGSVSSLNVSVACGVILFEAQRQRSRQSREL